MCQLVNVTNISKYISPYAPRAAVFTVTADLPAVIIILHVRKHVGYQVNAKGSIIANPLQHTAVAATVC